MAKSSIRAYSRIAAGALELLGKLIRSNRILRKMTAQEVAERAGISRGLVQRIEKGDPRCAIGVVFEVATIVGVVLFDADPAVISLKSQQTTEKLALLPRTVHKTEQDFDDDF